MGKIPVAGKSVKLEPFEHLIQHIKQTDPMLYEALKRISKYSSVIETAVNTPPAPAPAPADSAGAPPGPFHRTMLFKNLTPKADNTDHVTVFGAKEGESSTAFRVALTLRKTITADCTVVVHLTYQGTDHIVGTFVMPADQPVNTPKIFKVPDIIYVTFPDLSVLWGEITASDGSKDLDGVLS
jgi:hypothetical protein